MLTVHHATARCGWPFRSPSLLRKKEYGLTGKAFSFAFEIEQVVQDLVERLALVERELFERRPHSEAPEEVRVAFPARHCVSQFNTGSGWFGVKTFIRLLV